MNIDNTIIIAAEIIATAITEITEITFIKFFFRLERRYRLAIKRERFKVLAKEKVNYGFNGGIFRFLRRSSIRLALSSNSSL